MDFDPIKINTYKIDKSKFVAVFKINKSTNEKINLKELENFLKPKSKYLELKDVSKEKFCYIFDAGKWVKDNITNLEIVDNYTMKSKFKRSLPKSYERNLADNYLAFSIRESWVQYIPCLVQQNAYKSTIYEGNIDSQTIFFIDDL
jgi:hypothetical protein